MIINERERESMVRDYFWTRKIDRAQRNSALTLLSTNSEDKFCTTYFKLKINVKINLN